MGLRPWNGLTAAALLSGRCATGAESATRPPPRALSRLILADNPLFKNGVFASQCSRLPARRLLHSAAKRGESGSQKQGAALSTNSRPTQSLRISRPSAVISDPENRNLVESTSKRLDSFFDYNRKAKQSRAPGVYDLDWPRILQSLLSVSSPRRFESNGIEKPGSHLKNRETSKHNDVQLVDHHNHIGRVGSRDRKAVVKLIGALLYVRREHDRRSQTEEAMSHWPTTWTKPMFLYCVTKLTRTQPPRLIRKHSQHHQAVGQILSTLFARSDVRHALSVEAFGLAIKYFLAKGLQAFARSIFYKMKWFDLRPDLDIFNAFLRSCSTDQNLQTYQLFLEKLIAARHVPDWQTWITFLFLCRTPEHRRVVVRHMQQLKLLDDDTAKSKLVEALLHVSFGDYLSQGGSSAHFIELIDQDLGQGWFDIDTANFLSFELAKQGDISQAVDLVFVRLGAERNVVPNVDSLNNLLYICRLHMNTATMVWLVILFTSRWRVELNAKSYELLFSAAWKARTHNLALAIYSYACMLAHLSFQTEKLLKNAIADIPLKTNGSKARFRRQFLYAAIGVLGPRTGNLRRWRSHLRKFRSYGSTFSQPLQLPLFLRSPRSAFRLDLQHASRFAPTLPFQKIILTALRRDMIWSARNAHHACGATWKAVNTISVPKQVRRAFIPRDTDNKTSTTPPRIYNEPPKPTLTPSQSRSRHRRNRHTIFTSPLRKSISSSTATSSPIRLPTTFAHRPHPSSKRITLLLRTTKKIYSHVRRRHTLRYRRVQMAKLVRAVSNGYTRRPRRSKVSVKDQTKLRAADAVPSDSVSALRGRVERYLRGGL